MRSPFGGSLIGKTFVTRPIFQETIELLGKHTEVRSNPDDRVLSKSELIRNLADVDGAITLVTDTVDREILESARQLKVVANFGVGFNNVDVDSASSLGIAVTNTPGVLTETTADLAWSLLMSAARRIPEADRFVRAGRFKAWGPQMLLGQDVFGKTLGLIGLGRIGQAVARRARGFDMRTLFYDPELVPESTIEALGVRRATLDEIYREADFISLHVPLLPETKHLLNDRTFALMKKTCVVVNTSRGPVVDEKALVRALKDGRIAAAGLDVFEREPQIEADFFDLDNVVLAPHIGSASTETRLRMSMMTAENLLAVLNGNRPPNLVNPDVWERRRR